MMTRYRRKYLLFFGFGLGVFLFLYVNSSFYKLKTHAAAPKQERSLISSDEYDATPCPYPIVDPFHPSVIKLVDTFSTVNCVMGIPSIVYVKSDFLIVNTTKVKALHFSYDYCVYSPLLMENGSEYLIKTFDWSRRFHHSISLADEEEFLYVKCYYRNITVSESYHARFIRKTKTEQRSYTLYKQHLKRNTPLETFNILMIGLDGLSRQAFERSMPKMRKFLIDKLHAKELYKFNKLGHNTFPNVMPLLTNQHEEELLRLWSVHEPLDKINDLFVWDDYQKAGYRTALMTDVVEITAFHYMKEGWFKPPFDYYFRSIPVKTTYDNNIRNASENCIGDVPEVKLLLDYWLQMTSALNDSNNEAYGRSFFTRLSHDYSSLASRGDDLYVAFFDQLRKNNVLNNTVVIVFSDHGGRFGEVRATYNGMLESRMPFMFFIFPPWFKQKYPKAMATFETNRNRLSTMFDVHATLIDLLYFRGHTGKGGLTQRAISLFKEIPINRNCKHAGIPLKYCLCSTLHHGNVSITLTAILTYRLHQHILSFIEKHRDKCELLKIKSIKSILPVDNNVGALSFYQATIETKPGNAVFEATLSYDQMTNEASVEGDVVRLNMYRGQDTCVTDIALKSFCYCKSQLKNS